MLGKLTVSTLVLTIAITAQRPVHVVDRNSGTGSDFSQITDAIEAASEGDIILVRGGSYQTFFVDKALDIIAEQGARPFAPNIVVRDLNPDQRVTIRGFQAQPSLLVSAFTAGDCDGSILVEDCEFRGANGTGFGFPVTTSTTVERCASITFVRCGLFVPEIIVGPGSPTEEGSHGLVASDSSVSLFDCSLRGGANTLFAGQGGHGALISGGDLFASGCEFLGNQGGPAGEFVRFDPDQGGFVIIKSEGGAGGDGVRVDSEQGPSAVVLRDSAFLPGIGGIENQGCPAGADGLEVGGDTNPVQRLGDEARELQVDSPVTAGDAARFSFQGQPGDFAFLGLAPAQSQSTLAGFDAPFLLDGGFVVLPLGFASNDGTLAFDLPTPALPFGLSSLSFTLQSAALSTDLDPSLSSPSTLVILR